MDKILSANRLETMKKTFSPPTLASARLPAYSACAIEPTLLMYIRPVPLTVDETRQNDNRSGQPYNRMLKDLE